MRFSRIPVVSLVFVATLVACGRDADRAPSPSPAARADSLQPPSPARPPRPLVLDSRGLGEIGPGIGFTREVLAALLPGMEVRAVQLKYDVGTVQAFRAMTGERVEVELLPDATGSRPERIFVMGPSVPGPRDLRVGVRFVDVPGIEGLELRPGRGRLSGTLVAVLPGEPDVYLAFGPASGYWEPGAFPDGPILAQALLRMMVWAPRAEDLVDADAPAGIPAVGGDRVERVRFVKGETRTWLHDAIVPGGSIRYVFGARRGQTVEVRFWSANPSVRMAFTAPISDVLLEPSERPAGAPWTAQLERTGDCTLSIAVPDGVPGGDADCWIRLAIQ